MSKSLVYGFSWGKRLINTTNYYDNPHRTFESESQEIQVVLKLAIKSVNSDHEFLVISLFPVPAN